MPIYVGLLRAVNLAGKNAVSMSRLRELLADLGMEDARTLLQSGNVIFRSDIRSAAKVEKVLEDAVEKRFGLKTDFFVRTTEEMNTIVADNPFPREAKQDPGHLVVGFCREAPDAVRVDDVGVLEAHQRARREKARHS